MTAITFRDGSFTRTSTRMGQEVGRIEASDAQGNHLDVHAIQVQSGTLLGYLLKTSKIGRMLIKILYGSYSSHQTQDGYFLLSEHSAQAAVWQRKAMQHISTFLHSTMCQGDIQTKVSALFDKFRDDKEPFRQLVKYPHQQYKTQQEQFILSIEKGEVQVLLNNGQNGAATQANVIYSMVNITQQKMERWHMANPKNLVLEKAGADLTDFAYFDF